MAQINPTVGALEHNLEAIRSAYAAGATVGADLVLTPEMSIVGYPPEDLVLKPFFVKESWRALESLCAMTDQPGAPGLIVGLPVKVGEQLHNAVALIEDGEVKALRSKHELPNYGVFDEVRVFSAGPLPAVVPFRGFNLGLMICEDMWFDSVGMALAQQKADILLVPTCSPFELNKFYVRLGHAKDRTRDADVPLIFCNQVSGQDELVFEGASFVMNVDGSLAHQLHAWRPDSRLVHVSLNDGIATVDQGVQQSVTDGLESIYAAMMLGLKDYVAKTRFPGVVLGMSGGVDSALSAAVAADALGPENVHAIMMPSKYTSDESLTDAKQCADALGVRYDIITIKDGVAAYDLMLGDMFDGLEPNETEENIQSRLRGVLLMAVSNKFGNMVLTTGNKSEMSVGYATLYGDMCGGYSVLKDVYKLDVFALCLWRNENLPSGALAPEGLVIPENIITKPPTAELREDQKDEDSLPPYDVLDDILRGLVDDELSVADLVAKGHAKETVARIERLLYIAEYKRRQSPPGVKITARNFGRDRRYPITNGFRTART